MITIINKKYRVLNIYPHNQISRFWSHKTLITSVYMRSELDNLDVYKSKQLHKACYNQFIGYRNTLYTGK